MVKFVAFLSVQCMEFIQAWRWSVCKCVKWYSSPCRRLWQPSMTCNSSAFCCSSQIKWIEAVIRSSEMICGTNEEDPTWLVVIKMSCVVKLPKAWVCCSSQFAIFAHPFKWWTWHGMHIRHMCWPYVWHDGSCPWRCLSMVTERKWRYHCDLRECAANWFGPVLAIGWRLTICALVWWRHHVA